MRTTGSSSTSCSVVAITTFMLVVATAALEDFNAQVNSHNIITVK